MTDPLFLVDALGSPEVGGTFVLGGPEGHHAADVRRLRTGERVVVGDGRGRGVRGVVSAVARGELTLDVIELLADAESRPRFVVAQALAKGDRGEAAAEMLTEVGAAEIVPWQASRSIVRWTPDRADKALGRWRSTVREAAKQSRRLTVPTVAPLATTRDLVRRVATTALTLVLHEEAADRLAAVAVPPAAEVLVVVGPEGGITPEELSALADAGARTVRIADHVLRTSTAGVVALGALLNR